MSETIKLRKELKSKSFKEKFKIFGESLQFQYFITFVILAAGLVVGLQTNKHFSPHFLNFLQRLDDIILAIFVIEMAVYTLAEGKKPWRYFYDPWHIFDFIIVALCFIPYFFPNSNAQFFAVFRLARILRLAKIFEKIKALKFLLISLLKSIPSMSYVLMLLLLLFYIYSVVATDIFGRYAPDEFGSIWTSAKNLLFVAFEGWSWIYDIEGIKKMLEGGFPEWILALFFTSFLFVAAMIFLNLFIGIITSDMESTKEDEKRGKSKLYKQGHTLIFGWSTSVFKIIEELIEANDSKEKANIVILAAKDKSEMDFEIKEAFPKSKTTKIICRNGFSADLSDLKMVNAWDARSIIILKSDSEEANKNEKNFHDIQTIKTIIALSNDNLKQSSSNFHIVAEMFDKKFIKIAKSIGKDKLIVFDSDEFVSRLIAQSSFQPHLSNIYTEIIGFKGSEIYLRNNNEIRNYHFSGKKYCDVLFDFKNSCLIGYSKTDKYDTNEKYQLFINPKNANEINYELKDSDKLIFLAEDDSSIKNKKFTPPLSEIELIVKDKVEPIYKSKFLILGSNNNLPSVINEIHSYLKDSNTFGSLEVITEETLSIKAFAKFYEKNFKNEIKNQEITENLFTLPFLKVTFIKGNIEDKELLEKYSKEVEVIILLSYYDFKNDIQNADAISLVTLFHLREIGVENGRKMEIVTEMIDDANRELVDNPSVSDFIISSNITSSLIAQLSEEKALQDVFDQLFSSGGSEIYSRPAENYIKLNQEIHFATIVQSAFEKGETAIGFILKINDNLVTKLNPCKDTKVTFQDDDNVIVLAEN